MVPALVALLGACEGRPTVPAVASPAATAGKAARDGGLQRGRPVPARWARVPRFAANKDGDGIRALPDADLAEWEGVRWHPLSPAPAATRHGGRADLAARVAFASYGSGLSFAVEVRDDHHVAATGTSELGTSDHVAVELWPGRPPGTGPGVFLRLGTMRQLVQVVSPAGSWRDEKISATGDAAGVTALGGGGYRVEARIPLSVLTPLPEPEITSIGFRVTVHDADGGGRPAAATLRAEGTVALKPSMQVPEAVRKRGSVRVCIGSQDDALWGYENGWRCAIPYHDGGVQRDDTHGNRTRALGYARVPTPPRIVWIRERVLVVNFTGVRRGVVALLDGKDTILSSMQVGVVAAEDPGNPRVSESGVETLRLPDGTYAVAVTHAYPSRAGALGGRCAAGHRVYLSLIALRGCYRSTPDEPAPDPEFTPYLDEVFRVVLEDCESTVANDWSISRDRRTIRVHSSLCPGRPPSIWSYRDGRYRLAGEPGQR